MRRLVPDPTAVDLDAAYAWPAAPGQVVRANMVASADGAATRAGRSGGLSGPADKRVFATLRGLADVVLVGAGTARIEGYGPVRPSAERVRRRRAEGRPDAPPLAVVSGRLDLDPAGPLFADPAARPLVVTTAAAAAQRGPALAGLAELVVAGERTVELPAALDALAERGLRRVLCEGGPQLLAAVVAAGRLDELCLTVSPCLVGGAGPRPLRAQELDPPVELALTNVFAADGVLFLRYAVRRQPVPASSSSAVPSPPGSP